MVEKDFAFDFLALFEFNTLPEFAYHFTSPIHLLSNNIFYDIKYFVLTFSIDVVSPVSNNMVMQLSFATKYI